VRPLGEALTAAGFPVRAVRLPGHGTTPADLARTGWRDWLASAESALAALRAETPARGVASAGALCSPLHASRALEVEAIVCCGTPSRLRDRRRDLLRSLRWLPPVRRRFAFVQRDARHLSSAARAQPDYDVFPLPLMSVMELRGVVRRFAR
jgi:carboxylesterase